MCLASTQTIKHELKCGLKRFRYVRIIITWFRGISSTAAVNQMRAAVVSKSVRCISRTTRSCNINLKKKKTVLIDKSPSGSRYSALSEGAQLKVYPVLGEK